MTRKCAIDGCKRPHTGRGLCGTHYMRKRRRGHAVLPVPVRELPCTFKDCTNKQLARGLCGNHYRLWRVNGDPGVNLIPRWTPEEDATLLELPRYPRSGVVVHGYLASAADHLDRSYAACQTRLGILRSREAVRIREAALTHH